MAEELATADALLRRLEWTVLRRMDGLLQGDWRTFMRGGGIDLADLREYQLHDDVRHIDWNVTARLQTPHVRQFLEDRDLSAWMLLDLSGSVHFGSTEKSKLGVSTAFVATLARVITRHGNRVGAILYGREVGGVLPPGSSRTHVLNLVQRMQTFARKSAQTSKPNPARKPKRGEPPAERLAGTALADLLHAAEGMVKRRSLVIVVSDFISTPGWQSSLARLAQRHEVVAIRLLDPAEMKLPEVGLVTLEDAETGEQVFIDTSDPAFLQRYAQIAEATEEQLRNDLVASGADVLELATDDDLLDALMRYADMRRQRARLPPARRFPAEFQRATPLPETLAATENSA